MEHNIEKIIHQSIFFIEIKDYKSYDVSDALTSYWIDLITCKSNFARRVAIQINAKSPFSLHGLGMKKMVHTKLISDLLWTYSINQSLNMKSSIYRELIKLKCQGSEYVWGLNFPYNSRFVNANANIPNLYNTATTGLAISEFAMINYLEGQEEENLKILIGRVIDSIFHVFSFTDEVSKGWFTYYPNQKDPTYNVNALTAYFLCKANNVINLNTQTINVIQKIINLLITEQNNDGTWYYSRSKKGSWIDGFHTGFIIESLAYLYTHGYKSEKLKLTLLKAWNYYIQNLFTSDGFPKFYSNSKKFPIEAQNCAQAIQTISLVGLWLNWHHEKLLKQVINITINNLYNSSGYFYHKKLRYFTFKQSYFRWSTAPMLVALSYAKKYLDSK